jgi:hypothetical protein
MVSVTFHYSEIDYVRAMRAHYRSHLRVWRDVIVVILGGAAAAELWKSANFRWLSITLFGVLSVFALLMVAAFTLIPTVVFRREPKFRDEYALTFSEEGIHFTTAHVDSQLQWSIYSQALVDAHSYVLYYGARSLTIIPTRVFQNTAQQTVFEQLLEENIPRIIRKV